MAQRRTRLLQHFSRNIDPGYSPPGSGVRRAINPNAGATPLGGHATGPGSRYQPIGVQPPAVPVFRRNRVSFNNYVAARRGH